MRKTIHRYIWNINNFSIQIARTARIAAATMWKWHKKYRRLLHGAYRMPQSLVYGRYLPSLFVFYCVRLFEVAGSGMQLGWGRTAVLTEPANKQKPNHRRNLSSCYLAFNQKLSSSKLRRDMLCAEIQSLVAWCSRVRSFFCFVFDLLISFWC